MLRRRARAGLVRGLARGRELPSLATSCVMVLLGALARADEAHASPQDLFGYGPRTSALAGATAALADGFEAVWASPALLSQERRPALALGLLSAQFHLAKDGVRQPASPLVGTFIGGTLPLPFQGVLRDRVGLGVGFFTPSSLVVRGRILYPEQPVWPLAERAQSVAVQAGLGVHVWDGLRIGAGFSALAALSGAVFVAQDASGRIGTVVENSLVASYAPIASATYERWGYRVGLTYRGELAAPFRVVIQVNDLADLTVPPLGISGVAQYDPHQLALELARYAGETRVAVGATWRNWSSYPGPASATVECPTVDPDTGGPFEGACAPLVPKPPGYHDTVSARVALEHARTLGAGSRRVELAVRAGYAWEPTPVPKQTDERNTWDADRSVFSAGVGSALVPPLPGLRVDLFAQLHVLHERTQEKAADVPESNAGAPRVTTGGLVVASGLSVRGAF